jgi:hypothetical protein
MAKAPLPFEKDDSPDDDVKFAFKIFGGMAGCALLVFAAVVFIIAAGVKWAIS